MVFCVHDDSIALLEGYNEPKFAPSHNPEWTVPLQTTLHISHALVPIENESEFVVTLHNDVARFNAPSWEVMLEWVDTLRSKLREMKILSPRENVYSRLPEHRPPLLPTRDPTSPLPAPPPVPAALVPGIERLPLPQVTRCSENVTQTSSVTTSTVTTSTIVTPATNAQSQVAMSNTSIQNIMNLLSNPLERVSAALSESQNVVTQEVSTNGGESLETEPDMNSLARIFTNNVLESLDVPRRRRTQSSGDADLARSHSPERLSTNPFLNDDEPGSATNITIIQVSTPDLGAGSNHVTTTNGASEVTNDDYRSNVQIIPSNPLPTTTSVVEPTKPTKPTHKSKTKITADPVETTAISSGTVQVSSTSDTNEYGVVFAYSSSNLPTTPPAVITNGTTTSTPVVPVTNIPIRESSTESSQFKSQPQHYEQVFLSHTASAVAITNHQNQLPSTSSGMAVRIASPPPNLMAKPGARPVNGDALNHRQQLLNRGVTEISISRPSRSSERQNLVRPRPKNAPESHLDKLRGGDQEHRRRSSSTSEITNRHQQMTVINNGVEPARRLQPPPQPFRSIETQQNGNRMTLREQQVMQMRREMMHPGGVRLQLRRKDCLGSIGLVDAFNAVWVAGWKQKEHPVLYNALHIGDQLLSVAGNPVTSATEANKIIRSSQSLFVSIIVIIIFIIFYLYYILFFRLNLLLDVYLLVASTPLDVKLRDNA